MSNIKAIVDEFLDLKRSIEEISKESRRLAQEKKTYVQRQEELQANIDYFLDKHNLPAFKHRGFLVEKAEKKKVWRKNKEQKDGDILEVLRESGIEEPEEVLEKIIEAGKGEQSVVTTLKIKSAS